MGKTHRSFSINNALEKHPHMRGEDGSYAKEARIIMETDTIKNLLDVLFPGV